MSTLTWTTAADRDAAALASSIGEAAAGADGLSPFSEATVLALHQGGRAGSARILRSAGGEAAAVLIDDAAELAVAPPSRNLGLGREMVRRVLADHPEAALWAHGDLPAAQAVARATGLQVVRSLWRMSRPVDAQPPIAPPRIPPGFAARSFRVGADERAWLDLNARAFVHHPEQGRMTMSDLTERMSQPWFDPDGLLLIEDVTAKPPRLVASHWTKIEDPASGQGEVYVVAVDPDYQGRGLGRAVTALGLQHLASAGLTTVELYVEGDNDAAVATYSHLGFTRAAADVMYASRVHQNLGR